MKRITSKLGPKAHHSALCPGIQLIGHTFILNTCLPSERLRQILQWQRACQHSCDSPAGRMAESHSLAEIHASPSIQTQDADNLEADTDLMVARPIY